MDKSIGGANIGLERSRQLWVAKLMQHISNWDSNLGIVKQTSSLRLGGRSDDMAERFALNEQGTIDKMGQQVELKVTSNATAGSRFN